MSAEEISNAYEKLLDSIASGVIVHRDFQPLYVNRACVNLLGFASTAELLAQPSLLRLFSQDSQEIVKDCCDALLAEGRLHSPSIMQIHTADGGSIWVEVSQDLVDWRGKPAVTMTLVDAGKQMKTRKSEELLREAIDNLSDSFILYDADDRVVLTNRRFHELFPFLAPQDRIIGAAMRDLVSASVAAGVVTDATLREQNAEDWIDNFIARRHANKLYLEEDTWPDGHWDLVKEQSLNSGGFVSVRTDITDRKRAEFALKEHESKLATALVERTKQLEAVLANIAQGVIVLNPDLRVVLTNKGLHDIVGYPLELGKPGTHVEVLIRDRIAHGLRLPGEPQSNADVDAIVAARLQAYQDLTHETYRHKFPNGRLIEISRQKLPDGMIICTFTDVTDQANAQEELQRQREALYQREKLSALGMLLAGVAHELNNPLSIVLGQAHMIENQSTDEHLRRRAEQVRNAAQRCAKIIKTFLAMARDEPASRKPVQINAIIEQALDLIGYQLRSSGIEVIRNFMSSLPEILGDSDQLNQIIVNLLINASQAMENIGGDRRITIVTSYLAANREVELAISDTGPGVPEEFRRRIFDPFFTTKPVGIGTGVGLSVCHGMIRAHGGTIIVDDALGGGARFRVRLPVGTAGRAASAVGGHSKEASRGRVLVVDDHPEICEVLIEFLEKTGLDVQSTVTGREALRLLLAHDYDAIVCDLRMPGMDGPALYAEIERARPELLPRFVFATGDLLSESNRHFLAISGRPCLEKPFLPDQVRRLVTQVVERQSVQMPQKVRSEL